MKMTMSHKGGSTAKKASKAGISRVASLFAVFAIAVTAVFSLSSPTSLFDHFATGFSFGSANLFGSTVEAAPVKEASPAQVGESDTQDNPAFITTDRTDYNPGETVIITGSGWDAHELVSLEIKREGVVAANYQAFANEFGNVYHREFNIGDGDVGASFTLRAVGSNSNKTADSKFTDGALSYSPANFNFTGATAVISGSTFVDVVFDQTVTSPSDATSGFKASVSVTPNSTTFSGNPTIAFPVGFVVTTSPGDVNFSQNNQGKGWNVKIRVPANTTPGVYSALVGATPEASSGHTTGSVQTQVILEVKAPTPSDVTAPTTTALATANATSYASSSWTNQNVTVNLSATDNSGGAGVKNITYTVSGTGGPITNTVSGSSASINISAAGSSTITYFATDNANNSETPRDFFVNIDKTKPVIALNGVSPMNVTFGNTFSDPKATATDNVAPLTAEVTGVGTVNTNVVGQYSLTYNYTDVAGNAADQVTRIVNVVKAGQTITFDPLAGKTYGDADFAVSATASSSLPVSFAASGSCSITGNLVHITGAGSCDVIASQAGDANYNAAQSVTQSFAVGAKSLTPTVTVDDKIYDGTANAAITSRSLSGVINSDDVTLVGGTAAFVNKTVGQDKDVNITGLTLAGTKSGNYALSSTSATAQADITAKGISGAFTADNKVYDGGTAASVLTRALPTGIIVGDNVSLTGGTAAFDNKNVGNGRTVTLVGATLAGDDAGNYTLTSVATTTANITPLGLAGSFAANSKTYDGGTAASVASQSLPGVLGTDAVTLVVSNAQFDNKNVGTGKTVTADLSLTGAAAGNYTVNPTATTQADISAATVTGSFTANSKPYDGNNSATIAARSITGGIVGSENVTLTGGTATFADKNVGNGKLVTGTAFTLGGTDSSNYVLAPTTLTTTANITHLHVTGNFTADNKVYDGNASATVPTRTPTGAIFGDALSLTGGTATFDNKNVGVGKTVTLTGATLTGSDASNYVLDGVATTTASITQRPLTATISVANKVFDTNTSATITGCTLANTVSGDSIGCSFASATANFDTPLVGSNKPVNATALSLTGTDAPNYLFNGQGAGTGNIGSWTLNGFYQPVGIPNTYGILVPSMAGITWNSVKGGQTVPLKFNVFAGTVEKTHTSAVQNFSVGEVSCIEVGTSEELVEFVTTGATELRYSGTPGVDGQFIQNWQTPKTANKCYRTVMTTMDGSVLVAFFKTKK
jgi:hypothetical protein